MTTPNQVSPDGAFVIGGGDWGQNQQDNLLAILPPPPSPIDALEQFFQFLQSMPLEVLKVFEPFLEGVEGLFDSVGTAAEAIFNALTNSPVWLSVEAFFAWVAEFFDPLFKGFERLLDILSGNFLEPAGDAFDSVLAWLGDLLNIEKFAQAISDLIEWVLGIPGDVLETLAELLGLDFSGLEAFFDSIVTNIQNLTGLDLSSPLALFNSIVDIIENFFKSVFTVVSDVVRIVAQVLGYSNPPTNMTVAQLVTWVAGNVLSKLKNLTTQGMLQVSALLGLIPTTQVDGPGDFTNIGAAVTAAFDDIQKTLDEWYGALTGRPQVDATAELTADQIAELLATTTANATALAALQSVTQGNLTNMVASGDDFERDTLNPTPLWQQLSTGSGGGFSLVKGQMVWTDGGNLNHLQRFRRIAPGDSKTVTPYQRIARVNGTVIAENVLLTAGPGEDYIYGRVSDDFNRYIFARIRGDGEVSLGFTTSGPAGEQVRATATVATPTAGSTYALEIGDPANVRSCKLLRNNTPVLSHTFNADVATLDTLTGWGWGGKAVPRFAGQSSPGSIHSITVTDIPPNPTIGTYLHVCRDTAAAIAKAAGEVRLPNNTWTKKLRDSPDVLIDLTTGIFTMTKPGAYSAAVRVDLGADITDAEEWELLLYEVSGSTTTLLQRVGQTGGPKGLFASNTSNTAEGVFQFYVSKNNQQFVLGLRTTAQETIVGNANGDTTYFTITRCG